MLRTYSICAVLFMLLSAKIMATPYDACKDILRDGTRDTFSNQSSIDKRLVVHNQFCSMAKEYSLDEQNFNTFIGEYAEKTKSENDNYGGGAGIGIGPFSFNGNYGQTNTANDLSKAEKENYPIPSRLNCLGELMLILLLMPKRLLW